MKRHHDNREHTWHVSMNDAEHEIVEARRAETGLTKAEFGRQAFIGSKIISRTSMKDRQAMEDLRQMHGDILKLIDICEINQSDEIQKRILELEDKFAKIYNFVMTRV